MKKKTSKTPSVKPLPSALKRRIDVLWNRIGKLMMDPPSKAGWPDYFAYSELNGVRKPLSVRQLGEKLSDFERMAEVYESMHIHPRGKKVKSTALVDAILMVVVGGDPTSIDGITEDLEAVIRWKLEE